MSGKKDPQEKRKRRKQKEDGDGDDNEGSEDEDETPEEVAPEVASVTDGIFTVRKKKNFYPDFNVYEI